MFGSLSTGRCRQAPLRIRGRLSFCPRSRSGRESISDRDAPYCNEVTQALSGYALSGGDRPASRVLAQQPVNHLEHLDSLVVPCGKPVQSQDHLGIVVPDGLVREIVQKNEGFVVRYNPAASPSTLGALDLDGNRSAVWNKITVAAQVLLDCCRFLMYNPIRG